MPMLMRELHEIVGCGHLTAAKLSTASPGGVRRFRSEAAFAMHSGTGPLQVASDERQRRRLNLSGNRELNTGLHRIGSRRSGHPRRRSWIGSAGGLGTETPCGF